MPPAPAPFLHVPAGGPVDLLLPPAFMQRAPPAPAPARHSLHLYSVHQRRAILQATIAYIQLSLKVTSNQGREGRVKEELARGLEDLVHCGWEEGK